MKHPQEMSQWVSVRQPNGSIISTNRVAGIYLGDGKATVVKSPTGITITEVANLIPPTLRGLGFNLYLSPRKDAGRGEGGAINLLNEMSAYIFDAKIAMETHDRYFRARYGQQPGSSETEGAGEFVGYALALGTAIQGRAQAYANPKDREHTLAVIKHLCENAAASYREGMNSEKYPVFRNMQRHFLDTLRNSQLPEVARLRQFAIDTYGKEWFDALVAPPQIRR